MTERKQRFIRWNFKKPNYSDQNLRHLLLFGETMTIESYSIENLLKDIQQKNGIYE